VSSSTPRPPRPSTGSQRAQSGAGGRALRKSGKTPAKNRPKLTGKQKFRRALRYLLIAGVAFTLLMASVFYFAYESTKIPSPNQAFQAQTTNVYYADGRNKIGLFATQNRESIPLAEVPQVMQDAVVAAEDRTFWTNTGVDLKSILRAAFSNAQGNATQGASTITQQYVKLLYLSQQRTLTRKIKEIFLSLKIHNQQSKAQILEGYLNIVYFGRGAYGVQAAANAFFGIPAKQLNASQSAMLAAVLNSPNYLSPDGGAQSRAALTQRYDYVLNGMVTAGKLTQAQESPIYDKLPALRKQSTSNLYGGQNGFMLDMVKSELLKLGFDDAQIQGGGLSVVTTFTRKAMAATRNGVLAEKPTGLPQLHAAAASVDVKTGALLGFFAGQDYLKSQLNWAAIGDSPGSAFKPFALTAGIEAGFSLKSTFQGYSPYRFPSGLAIKNEGQGDGHSYGTKVNLIKATQESINTAYIDLTASIPNGPQKIMDTAIKMGVPANSPGLAPEATIALGSATVSPINMANAYSTIADGGLEHKVFVISKVTRASDGEVLYTAPVKTQRAVPENVAADVSYALQQTVTGGTGQNALALGRPDAGKTGTATKNGGKVITSCFTPQIATAVMYVRGDGQQTLEGYLNPFFGATYPTKTWTAIMTSLMDRLPVVQFPPPAYVTGTPPGSGHAPLPTFTPTPTPSPTPKPTPSRTPSPTPSPSPTPTPTPTPSPTGPCTPTVLNPCSTPTG
jgi:membrane peptidoglycan carboxypeptidase